MKTPMQQLIDRLESLYDLNPMEQEYREGLADAIVEAKLMLPFEKSHIKHAWQEGSEGILTQSATEYFNDVYNQKPNEDEQL
jgi:hypothetical protein